MPSTQLRQNELAAARRIVVKFGSQVLSGKDGRIDVDYVRDVARQIAELKSKGFEVTMVSSGAISAGCAELGLKTRPRDVAALQAVAAVGQRRLMALMHEVFAAHKLEVGQVLVTRGDFDDRSRFLNIRNCVNQLHAFGCVPVINENDTVAVEEIRFGDNDLLAAMLCNALRADALVLLTVVDGLLDSDGNRIDLVEDIAGVTQHLRSDKSPLGSGGMSTKLEAARLAADAGELAVIANGRATDVLLKLFTGDSVGIGTLFSPAGRKLDSRRRWIGLTKRPAGTITIDDGAKNALGKRGKSLLAAGITAVKGKFERGEVVSICDTDGTEVARGLTNYAADEIEQVKGKRSNQLEKTLGRAAYAEVVHRDNLVMTGV